MLLSGSRYHAQLMLDSASRAGTLAVADSYAVKERHGYGKGDYHVYNKLDKTQANKNVNAIITAIAKVADI